MYTIYHQRKDVKAQRRKDESSLLRPCVFATLRFKCVPVRMYTFFYQRKVAKMKRAAYGGVLL